MDMQKPGPRGRSSSINPGPGAAVECKTPVVARGGCWCLELTDALCQSALKHGQRTFLYSAMGELVCSGQLWARAALSSFAVTRSDSESIFQQQFGEYHGYDGCYSIYFDSSTIVRLSDLLQKSRMTILGLAGVLFCENEQA